MAEGMFKKMTKPNEYIIESAGLMASSGERVSSNAIEACKEIGVNISSHQSKPITEVENIDQVDLFVTMTSSHAQVLKKLNISEDKIVVLGEEIPDPYMMDINEYRKTRDKIKEALNDLYKKIRADKVDT